jgi:hypothetical protein
MPRRRIIQLLKAPSQALITYKHRNFLLTNPPPTTTSSSYPIIFNHLLPEPSITRVKRYITPDTTFEQPYIPDSILHKYFSREKYEERTQKDQTEKEHQLLLQQLIDGNAPCHRPIAPWTKMAFLPDINRRIIWFFQCIFKNSTCSAMDIECDPAITGYAYTALKGVR